MTFLTTNSSPYGNQMQNQWKASPQQGSSQQRSPFWSALFGHPEENYQQSTLGPDQMGNFRSLQGAAQGPGSGGAFGQSADYYRDLLSDDSQTANQMMAPDMRRFQQDILPQIAERFSGYGGAGSSGFRNASLQAGTDLAERLGSIRANLRQQGAQGLQGIGQSSLGNYYENINRPETGGLIGGTLKGLGEGFGKVAGTWLGGKMG